MALGFATTEEEDKNIEERRNKEISKEAPMDEESERMCDGQVPICDCRHVLLASAVVVESVLVHVVDSSESETKSEKGKGGREPQEECPPLSRGQDGGGAADVSPTVEGNGDGEKARDEGGGHRKCGANRAREGRVEAPVVKSLRRH